MQSQGGGQLRGGQDAPQPVPSLSTAQMRADRHEQRRYAHVSVAYLTMLSVTQNIYSIK